MWRDIGWYLIMRCDHCHCKCVVNKCHVLRCVEIFLVRSDSRCSRKISMGSSWPERPLTQFIHPSIHPSVRPSVHPSVRPSVRLSVCLSICLSVYVFLCLTLYVYLSVWLCLSLFRYQCLLQATLTCIWVLLTEYTKAALSCTWLIAAAPDSRRPKLYQDSYRHVYMSTSYVQQSLQALTGYKRKLNT